MTKYTTKLKAELETCGLMPIIETEVINLKTGEKDWINCEVFFRGNSLIAQREAVSTKERKSKFIANNRVLVDDCFSLDEHLQQISEEITNSLIEGDLFDLV